MDVFDLKEGQDKYAYMERMVTDQTVTHVLAFCDKAYAEKADARRAGVGTESQILSKEIYDKVEQSKVIPIVCEFADDETPTLPVFFKARKWIDFSSDEAINRNWEQLIRLLFGKPLYQKAALGRPPAFITEDSSLPPNPIAATFSSLKQAVFRGKPILAAYRRDFLDACIDYADRLRTRNPADVNQLHQLLAKTFNDCKQLTVARDFITDWVLLESETTSPENLTEILLEFLERLCQLRYRPAELTTWNDAWFEGHVVFVYETFLYVVAALLKTNSHALLHSVFFNRHMDSRYGTPQLDNFGVFSGSAPSLNALIAPAGQQYKSPAAEIITRQAQRGDLPFTSLMQAELLATLVAFASKDVLWFPQTLFYMGHGTTFPFFVRAAQHGNFTKLATIIGIQSADELRTPVKEGQSRLGVQQWHHFSLWDRTLWSSMNMDALDTLP